MMRRKIRLGALLAVSVLMLALLIGGLYGVFTDEETSQGNVFVAGYLNLVAVTDGQATGCSYDVTPGGDAVDGYVVFGAGATPEPIVPGDSGYIEWSMTNESYVDGNLTIVMDLLDGDDVDLQEAEQAYALNDNGGNGDLDENIEVQLVGESGTIFDWQSLADLQTDLSTWTGEAMDGDNGLDAHVFTLNWRVPGTATSIIQSDEAYVGFTFTLTQV